MMPVTINSTTPNKTINISIIDDAEFEGTEDFMLQLNFTGGETHRLNLRPRTAIVKILDNDSKLFVLAVAEPFVMSIAASKLIGAVVGSLSFVLLSIAMVLIVICIYRYRKLRKG